ncbi:hypothetical protein YC2023_087717 [Brassica napus]
MCVTENARVPSDSAHVELDSTFNLLDDIFPDISANMNEEHEEGLSGQPMDTDRPSASSGNSKKGEGFDEMFADYNQELYPGCDKFTKLSFILKLYHIKCMCGISDKGISMVLDLMKEAFSHAKLPDSFNDMKKEKLTTLLGQKSHVTNNDIASLDDEYAQVFGPERPGRVQCVGPGPTPSKLVNHSPVTRQEIENSEMVIDLKSQVKELSDQVKGMTTFIQQVIDTSTGEQARVWASSFAVAFANILNPAFANVPSPPNPNQERSDDAVRD